MESVGSFWLYPVNSAVITDIKKTVKENTDMKPA